MSVKNRLVRSFLSRRDVVRSKVVAAKVKRTPEERAEVAAFVHHLFLLSGASTQTEWAEMAGIHQTSVNKYLTATDVPDGVNVLRLLRTLTPEILGALAPGVSDANGKPRGRLGALEEKVAGILAWQTETISILDEQGTRLERLENAPTPGQEKAGDGP